MVIALCQYKDYYAPAFRRRRHYIFGLSVRPSIRLSVRSSVHPKPEIPPFDLYMGPLVHRTNCDRFTACPSVCLSVRPKRFPGICQRTHGGNGLKFYMLMYLDHFQNWLVYGHGLLIFSCDQAALWMVFSVRLSVCPSVCPSVRLSICHTFLTMFPSSYHHEIFRSYHIGPG